MLAATQVAGSNAQSSGQVGNSAANGRGAAKKKKHKKRAAHTHHNDILRLCKVTNCTTAYTFATVSAHDHMAKRSTHDAKAVLLLPPATVE